MYQKYGGHVCRFNRLVISKSHFRFLEISFVMKLRCLISACFGIPLSLDGLREHLNLFKSSQVQNLPSLFIVFHRSKNILKEKRVESKKEKLRFKPPFTFFFLKICSLLIQKAFFYLHRSSNPLMCVASRIKDYTPFLHPS